MTILDTVNRIFREFKRYTGDGQSNEPTGAPLPIGDPQSGPYSPKKSELRAAFIDILGQAEDDAEAAAEALAEFERLYLGAKAADPATDNEGGVLETGALYFNTVDGKFRVWTAGDVWQDQSTALSDGDVTEPKLASALALSIGSVVADRAALKALNTGRYQVASLIEAGRAGVFDLVTYATYSAVVTADTAEAIIVRSTQDTAKAWLRRDHHELNVMWAGASPAASNATNKAALQAIFAVIDELGYGNALVPSGVNYGYDTNDASTHPNRIAKADGITVDFLTTDYGPGITYTLPAKEGSQVRWFFYTVQTTPSVGQHDGNGHWISADWNPYLCINVNQDYAAVGDPSRTADDNLRASLFFAHSGSVMWGFQTGGVTGAGFTTEEMLRFNMNVIGVPDLGLTDQTAIWTVQKTNVKVDWYTNDWTLHCRDNGLTKLFEITTNEATQVVSVLDNLNTRVQWTVGTGTASSANALSLAIDGSAKWDFVKLGHFYPRADNTLNIGAGSLRIKELFAATGTINTSDGDTKTGVIDAFSDHAAMRAVRRVNLVRYQFKDSAFEKGPDGARLHFGVIAQQVQEAFEAEGLDAFRYGLLCFDEWEDQFDEVQEQDEDADGNLLWDEWVAPAEVPKMVERDGKMVLGLVTVEEPVRKPRIRIRRELRIAAGSRYGVRYDELWALMLAAERQRNDEIEARLAAIEAA